MSEEAGAAAAQQPKQHRKPHSHIVTDGIERAAARGMLRAVGKRRKVLDHE